MKTDTDTETTWGDPVKVKSLISISETDNKDNVTFYSDDAVEDVIPTFSSKEVSIELGYLTPELEALITGNEYKNGLLTQSATATSKNFAIMFEAPMSKGGYRKICYYKGVLSRDEASYQTKGDSIESSNVTLKGVFMPLQSNGLTKISKTHGNKLVSGIINCILKKDAEIIELKKGKGHKLTLIDKVEQ